LIIFGKGKIGAHNARRREVSITSQVRVTLKILGNSYRIVGRRPESQLCTIKGITDPRPEGRGLSFILSLISLHCEEARLIICFIKIWIPKEGDSRIVNML